MVDAEVLEFGHAGVAYPTDLLFCSTLLCVVRSQAPAADGWVDSSPHCLLADAAASHLLCCTAHQLSCHLVSHLRDPEAFNALDHIFAPGMRALWKAVGQPTQQAAATGAVPCRTPNDDDLLVASVLLTERTEAELVLSAQQLLLPLGGQLAFNPLQLANRPQSFPRPPSTSFARRPGRHGVLFQLWDWERPDPVLQRYPVRRPHGLGPSRLSHCYLSFPQLRAPCRSLSSLAIPLLLSIFDWKGKYNGYFQDTALVGQSRERSRCAITLGDKFPVGRGAGAGRRG